MQNKRLANLAGCVQLAGEHLALRLAWGKIVMVIQPDFTPGDAFRFAHHRKQLRMRLIRIRIRIVRMHARGPIQPRARRRQRSA